MGNNFTWQLLAVISLSFSSIIFYLSNQQQSTKYKSKVSKYSDLKFISIQGLNNIKINYLSVDTVTELKLQFQNIGNYSWNKGKYDLFLQQVNHTNCNDLFIISKFSPIQMNVIRSQELTVLGYISLSPTQPLPYSSTPTTNHILQVHVCHIGWKLYIQHNKTYSHLLGETPSYPMSYTNLTSASISLQNGTLPLPYPYFHPYFLDLNTT